MSNDLTKRAIACKGWRWMPGMALLPVGEWPKGHTRLDARITAVDPRPGMGPWGSQGYLDMPLWLPDLTDPATLGCLLALVREAYGDPFARVQGSERIGRHVWRCLARSWFNKRTYMINGSTEAEALVAALLAAP